MSGQFSFCVVPTYWALHTFRRRFVADAIMPRFSGGVIDAGLDLAGSFGPLNSELSHHGQQEGVHHHVLHGHMGALPGGDPRKIESEVWVLGVLTLDESDIFVPSWNHLR